MLHCSKIQGCFSPCTAKTHMVILIQNIVTLLSYVASHYNLMAVLTSFLSFMFFQSCIFRQNAVQWLIFNLECNNRIFNHSTCKLSSP